MGNDEMIYEQEIRFTDVLVHVLLAWKKILLVASIGTILLVSYIMISTFSQKSVLVMNADEIAEAKVIIEENEVLIMDNEEILEEKELALDDLESSIEANEIAISDREKEITRVEKRIEELEEVEKIYQTMVDSMLSLDIVDEDLATQVMSFTVKIAETQDAIYQMETRNVLLNREIRDLMKANETVLPKEIADVKAQVKELSEETELMQQECNELETQMKATVSSEFDIVKVVFFAVLGFILGFGVSCGYIVVSMIFDNKIHNTRVLERRYGLYLLGAVSVDEKKKSIFSKLIFKLTGTDRACCSDDEKRVIVSRIKTFSKTNKVMAIGTINEENICAAINELKRVVPFVDFELISASNPMYSSETVSQLKDYELILVEKVDETKTEELDKLIRFLRKSEATVLGVVVV